MFKSFDAFFHRKWACCSNDAKTKRRRLETQPRHHHESPKTGPDLETCSRKKYNGTGVTWFDRYAKAMMLDSTSDLRNHHVGSPRSTLGVTTAFLSAKGSFSASSS